MPLSSNQSYSKPLKSSVKLREYLFALLMLMCISGLLTYKSVSAATLPLKQVFVSDIGQDLAQQKYDYRLAKYAFETRDYFFSFRLLKVLAEQGHKSAQNLLATQYDSGLGVKQDAYQAFRWYKKAAKAGVRIAQHNLAVAYSQGNGGKSKFSKSRKVVGTGCSERTYRFAV